jgi:tape measure domain-containing protein
MALSVGNLVAYLGLDITDLKRDSKKAENRVKSTARSINASLGSIRSMALGLFAGFSVGALVKEIFTVGVAADKVALSLEAATGSAEGAAAAMTLLQEQSKRLGVSFSSQVKTFTQIAAAARGTTLQGQATVDIFNAVSEASVALQLSSDETAGAIRALSQMISKGKVQAEELRGQLGERLPGAFQIAAKAMGTSTAGLSKMLEEGKVYSEDFIPKFAIALRERFAGSVEKSSQSIQSNINRLGTAWRNFMVVIFQSGFGDMANMMIKGITSILNRWRDGITLMMQAGLIFVDGIIKSWIELKFQWKLFSEVIKLAWQNTINGMKLLLMDFIDGVAKVFSILPFMDSTSEAIGKAARRLEANIVPTQTLADVVARLNEEKQKELQNHNGIIEAIHFENEANGELISSTTEYADAVGKVNKNSEDRVKITAEMIKLSKKQAAIRAADIKHQIEQQSMVAGAILEADKKAAEEKKKQEETKRKLQATTMKQMVTDAKFAFREFGKQNRAAFEAFKAISIAETVVNTAKAAMGAYSAMASIPYVGPALGVAAAAAAIAAGAAQIATISSMSPGGGGGLTSPGGAVGTYAASPTTGIPAGISGSGEEKQSTIEFVFHGDLVVDTDERHAQLMEDMRQLGQELELVN